MPINDPVRVIPNALPRLLAGKMDAIIAKRFPKIIAQLNPCRTLKKINILTEKDNVASREDKVNKIIPYVKKRFLPYISAILPIGTRHTARDKR